MSFESLPVELIAEILSELDLSSLVKVSYLSRRLRHICSDSSLNPWRRPILRNLNSSVPTYDSCLATLSVRTTVPRQNWVEILSMARAPFLLYEATLPNLREAEWEECFRRRFLPGWTKWRKEGRWRKAFLKILLRVWHRSQSSCTTDEAWTKYIVLNRNGSANEQDAFSRNFSPLALLQEMKIQNGLDHLESSVRLVVEFADVRILALGVLHKPRSQFMVNANAPLFLHPPGIESSDENHPKHATEKFPDGIQEVTEQGDASTSSTSSAPSSPSRRTAFRSHVQPYERLSHPLPSVGHQNYPFFTPSGRDKRWLGSGALEEDGRQWLGGLLLTAQLVSPDTLATDGPDDLQDAGLVSGPGRHQYASFSWPDLEAIGPWMNDRITKKINGPGLGN